MRSVEYYNGFNFNGGEMARLLPYGLITVLLFCFTASCNRVMPGGFWMHFEKKFLAKNVSDQGPYGGNRSMYWECNQAGTFKFDQIRRYAERNGWVFVDSMSISADDLKTWRYGDEMIFPLTSKGFEPRIEAIDGTFNLFPRWISEDIKLFKFKTNWILTEPGTDSSRPAYGYVIVNMRQDKMSVYHFWGD